MRWSNFFSVRPLIATLLVATTLFAAGCGCQTQDSPASGQNDGDEESESAPSPPKPLLEGWDKPAVAMVLSGRQHGYLEPCGCSETQSGGVARRADLIRKMSERGWTSVGFDVGGTARRHRQQDKLKFQALLSALKQMSYKGLALGPEELHFGADSLLQYHQPNEMIPFLAANVSIYQTSAEAYEMDARVIEAGGVKIGVTGILSPKLALQAIPSVGNQTLSVSPPADVLPAAIEKLEAAKPDLMLLLAHAETDESKQLAEAFPEFDLILTAGGPEDPDGKPIRVGETLLLEVGQKGKNVGVVGYYPDAEERFRFELVNLDNVRFENHPAMNKVMAEYQQMLEDLDIVGNSQPIGHPSGAEYVGAKVCGTCHTKAYEKWTTTPHSHAYESLSRGREGQEETWVSRIHDPECLACHVTGWAPQKVLRYESGFLNMETTPQLAGQQCENCHGPGSRHVELENLWKTDRKNADESQLMAERRALHRSIETAEQNVCTKCHDLDNSPNFEFKKYWEEVKHPWRD